MVPLSQAELDQLLNAAEAPKPSLKAADSTLEDAKPSAPELPLDWQAAVTTYQAAGNEAEKMAAFESIVRTYSGVMLRFACSIVKAPQLAEDVLQDSWLSAFRSFDGFEIQDKGTLQSWLMRIVHNTAINQIRARTRAGYIGNPPRLLQPTEEDDPLMLLEERSGGPEATLEILEQQDNIDQLLQNMPKKHRDVLVLLLEGRQYDEIAQILQVPVGTVRSRIHRCRKQVARSLRSSNSLLKNS